MTPRERLARARVNALHADAALQSAAITYAKALDALGGLDHPAAAARRRAYEDALAVLYVAAKKCTNARHEVGRAEKGVRDA
jgi:hypothetical protein